jgi:F-type H+-transporting ATPase subunit b
MDKILFLSILLSSAAVEAAEKAGMPQLNPGTWFPQIFWLIITFSFLYIIISKIVLPRLSESIEQRNDHISDNIDEARNLKNQAEEQYQEYLKVIAKAKKEAQDLIEKNKKNLQEVEKEINNFKNAAMTSINDIAQQIAKNLVKKVSNVETNEASARAIVDEVSKKYMRGLN